MTSTDRATQTPAAKKHSTREATVAANAQRKPQYAEQCVQVSGPRHAVLRDRSNHAEKPPTVDKQGVNKSVLEALQHAEESVTIINNTGVKTNIINTTNQKDPIKENQDLIRYPEETSITVQYLTKTERTDDKQRRSGHRQRTERSPAPETRRNNNRAPTAEAHRVQVSPVTAGRHVQKRPVPSAKRRPDRVAATPKRARDHAYPASAPPRLRRHPSARARRAKRSPTPKARRKQKALTSEPRRLQLIPPLPIRRVATSSSTSSRPHAPPSQHTQWLLRRRTADTALHFEDEEEGRTTGSSRAHSAEPQASSEDDPSLLELRAAVAGAGRGAPAATPSRPWKLLRRIRSALLAPLSCVRAKSKGEDAGEVASPLLECLAQPAKHYRLCEFQSSDSSLT